MKTEWRRPFVEKDVLDNLTRERLLELERVPRTPLRVFFDTLVCFLPVAAGCLAVTEYLALPDFNGYSGGLTYTCFLSFLIALALGWFLAALCSRSAFYVLRHKAPFYAFVFLLLAGYDVLTLKTGILVLPYFPWADEILSAMWQDRAYLLDCTKNSLILLFSGYSVGALLGLITGMACGCSRKVDYWIAPFMKLLGAIPSPTWIPIVMVIASSLFTGSVFIISLGVWY